MSTLVYKVYIEFSHFPDVSHRYDETFRFFLCSSGCIDQVFFNIHKLSTLKAIDWQFFHDF